MKFSSNIFKFLSFNQWYYLTQKSLCSKTICIQQKNWKFICLQYTKTGWFNKKHIHLQQLCDILPVDRRRCHSRQDIGISATMSSMALCCCQTHCFHSWIAPKKTVTTNHRCHWPWTVLEHTVWNCLVLNLASALWTFFFSKSNKLSKINLSSVRSSFLLNTILKYTKL